MEVLFIMEPKAATQLLFLVDSLFRMVIHSTFCIHGSSQYSSYHIVIFFLCLCSIVLHWSLIVLPSVTLASVASLAFTTCTVFFTLILTSIIVTTVVVNVIAINISTKKTLLPWNICDVTENEHTFSDFFKYTILTRIPTTSGVSYELVSAELGISKESWLGFASYSSYWVIW